MRYLLLTMVTLFMMGCNDETKPNQPEVKQEIKQEVKQPLVPQTKNNTLKPPAIPAL